MVTGGERIWAIEVKSGRPGRLSGIATFKQRYPGAQVWLVGGGGVDLADFFTRPATEWFT